jgi:DNA polymerase-1
LIAGKDDAFMSKDLATIRQDAPLEMGLEIPNTPVLIWINCGPFYTDLDMRQALNKLNKQTPAVQPKAHYVVISDANLDQLLAVDEPIAFEIEMLTENYHTAEPIGWFVGTESEVYVSADATLLSLATSANLVECA